jgi:hypothetical protein
VRRTRARARPIDARTRGSPRHHRAQGRLIALASSNYLDWKGFEDAVEEGLEAAGIHFETQQYGFGQRPDVAILADDGLRVCNVEVKAYGLANPDSKFDDVAQAEAHLAIAKTSEWGELHYVTPDGTTASFSPRMQQWVAANSERVFVHSVKDLDNMFQQLRDRFANPPEHPAEGAVETVGREVEAGAEDLSVGLIDLVDTMADVAGEVVQKLVGDQ